MEEHRAVNLVNSHLDLAALDCKGEKGILRAGVMIMPALTQLLSYYQRNPLEASLHIKPTLSPQAFGQSTVFTFAM